MTDKRYNPFDYDDNPLGIMDSMWLLTKLAMYNYYLSTMWITAPEQACELARISIATN